MPRGRAAARPRADGLWFDGSMHTDDSLRAPGSLRLFANGLVHAFADVPAEVPPAEAVLVRDGRVVAVGSTRELRDRAGAGPVEEVDLEEIGRAHV